MLQVSSRSYEREHWTLKSICKQSREPSLPDKVQRLLLRMHRSNALSYRKVHRYHNITPVPIKQLICNILCNVSGRQQASISILGSAGLVALKNGVMIGSAVDKQFSRDGSLLQEKVPSP